MALAGSPTSVEVALDGCEVAFEDLLKVVEDGGLGEHDDLGLVAVVQRFERFRNRLADQLPLMSGS